MALLVEKVLKRIEKPTQCRAWVHDASNSGPVRIGSFVIGFPIIGYCS
jgi:hypothetical protein